MIDSTQLAAMLRTRALEPFRLEPQATRQALQTLADLATDGSLMPDTQHLGLGRPCRVVEVRNDALWLQTPSAHPLPLTGTALAVFALGQRLLRFELSGLAAGGCPTRLRCDCPPAAWQLPRRELFRVAPPAQPAMSLRARAPGGVGIWRGPLIDLGIGGLAFELASEPIPCAVDQVLPACVLSGGSYRSPTFHLRVRSVQTRKTTGHWRIGASLLDSPREVVSSLQLATYRFEVAQRLERIARREPPAQADPLEATAPQPRELSAPRRQDDRP